MRGRHAGHHYERVKEQKTMRLVTTGILAALMMMPQSAVATDDYEIDLKELRRITPPRSVKTDPHKHTRHTAAEPAANKTAEAGESIYVVQPGDHLFLILMKKYGLSDPQAEQLIPNVMQLNGISSPKGLKVGQRLRIPLPAGERTRNVAIPESVPALRTTAPTATETTVASEPARAQVTTQASSPQPAEHPSAEIISIISESPCKLARNLVKKWGLPASSAAAITGAEKVDAAHAGRSVTVICGLSEAEQYTYERLLTLNGTQLLFFDQDESADYVVEELAGSLGLAFQQRDADAATLPLTYIFPPFGSRTQELQLTIFPSAQPE